MSWVSHATCSGLFLSDSIGILGIFLGFSWDHLGFLVVMLRVDSGRILGRFSEDSYTTVTNDEIRLLLILAGFLPRD